MKTEEIKKSAKKYAKSLEIGDCLMLQFGELEKYAKRDFKAGAEFINQHWQEKTRWISVNERLPELKKEPYYIVCKNENDNYCHLLTIDNFENYIYKEAIKSFTHWKEIEL